MSTVYYTDDLVTLYQADCLEELAWLHADVLITDPPYGLQGGLGRVYKGRTPHFEVPAWDTDLEVRDAAMALWGVDRPYAVFGSPSRLDAALPFKGLPLIWDKVNPGMGSSNWPWWRGYELIYVNGPGWRGRQSTPIIRVGRTSRDPAAEGHPTPKPVSLMGVLVRAAPPGVIADPFCGTGSTLRAAKDEGRQAVGVELEEAYCELAARRLSQEVLPYDPADDLAATAAFEEPSTP